MVKYVPTYTKGSHTHTKKKRSAKEFINDAYAMFLCFFLCFFFSSDFLYKSICCRYTFELHGQVDAIQMITHNI